MKRVGVRFPDVCKYYDNVTRLVFYPESECCLAYYVIYQGKKSTVILLCEIEYLVVD